MAVTRAQDEVTSVNPATEEVTARFPIASESQVETALENGAGAYRDWKKSSFAERGRLFRAAATNLRANKARYAGLITLEMGKPIAESEAEIEKCAWNCEYYAQNAERFLADEQHPSSATESYVAFDPVGTVLAIMPWNFPFWQLFRFAAPALMAGNTAILKHASNVPQCALAIEEVFTAAGFPEGVFKTLLIPGSTAEKMIEDRRIAAVTLTGSTAAGKAVASAAGAAVKKCVLELGGSDPFVVLEDADIEAAVAAATRGRNQNTGQSCIASKRIIVVEAIADEFIERFATSVSALRVGNPAERSTQVGPMARMDLLDALDKQVKSS
ncbi:MAG TPA: aldehyde dehydrogenase family protein, partial [Chloroflexota bacterium]